MLGPSRRRFLQLAGGALGFARASLKSFGRPSGASRKGGSTGPEDIVHRLFPEGLKDGDWREFRAAGYTPPVTGIVYRTDAASFFSAYVDRPRPCSGMPLGGIDTGALYLEPSGIFGYSSIFNNMTPIGGPLNTPYLGVRIGDKTSVCTTSQTKTYAGNNKPALGINLALLGAGGCGRSEYWGHYPIADVEYHLDLPVQVGLRAWSPFIPGDAQTSNTPGAVFEVHLRNASSLPQAGTLAFSFPGFRHHHTHNEVLNWPNLSATPVLPPPEITRGPLPKGLAGVRIEDKDWGMSYVVAVCGEGEVRTGGALGTDGLKWAAIDRRLPEPGDQDDGGSSLAAPFSIDSGQEKVIRIILAWYAPDWEGNGNPGTGGKRIITEPPSGYLEPSTTGKRFTHMYAKRFADAGQVAQFLAQNHEQLLKRIIAWQSVIYEENGLPGWLADALINSLYYFAPCSMWAQAKDPIGHWCKPGDGLFALEESPRACPHVSTLSNLGMGGPALSFFFPECNVSSLRAVRATQKENGDLAQLLGRWADPANPLAYDYQEVVVGACYMVQAYWHWKIHSDDEFLKEFYPSAQKALEFSFSQRPDLGLTQIIAMPPYRPHTWNDSDWFEDRSYYGYVADAGGFRLAAAEMLREWAQKIGDDQEAKKLNEMLGASKRAMQNCLWTGDHYLVYNDTETGKKLDAFFTPTLNGQYFASFNGVPRVLPKANVQRMLSIIRDKICKETKTGMPPNYCNADGSLWQGNNGYLSGTYIYNNHQIIWLSVLAIYEGMREFGLELLRKSLEIISCKWGYIWDGPNSMSGGGDDGEANYGWDYWFNWSIWTAPAALAGKDVSELAKPGGLVRRIIEAGRG
jgi:uncharacterized protein (DUF608 family)